MPWCGGARQPVACNTARVEQKDLRRRRGQNGRKETYHGFLRKLPDLLDRAGRALLELHAVDLKNEHQDQSSVLNACKGRSGGLHQTNRAIWYGLGYFEAEHRLGRVFSSGAEKKHPSRALPLRPLCVLHLFC